MSIESRSDIDSLSALDLRRLYASRELSPVEVAEHVLAAIEARDGELRAFMTVTPELALEQAHRAESAYASGGELAPLTGIPTSLKDLLVTRGIRTTNGSLLYENWVPDFDSPVSERIQEAGAVILGKTNTPEFGWKGDSGNRLIGPTHNPWRHGATAGGSSGGAAAAVGAGLGPVAQGSDGAGSIRIPCGFCGVFGIKPSYGLVARYPESATGTLSHNGPISRTVRDSALLLDVMAGPDERDQHARRHEGAGFLAACDRGVEGLRVAWSPDLGFAQPDRRVVEVAEAAARRFADLGCRLESPDLGLEDPLEFMEPVWTTANAARHADDFDQVRDRLDPGRVKVIEEGFKVSGVEVALAHQRRNEYRDRMREALAPYDLLLTPTLPVTAFPAGNNAPDGDDSVSALAWTKFTYPFNQTGQPAATVPAGFVDGLPVGLQIVGRWLEDELVLAASAAFEAAQPWPFP